jgi:hypothetical protein
MRADDLRRAAVRRRKEAAESDLVNRQGQAGLDPEDRAEEERRARGGKDSPYHCHPPPPEGIKG